ncbi:DUF1540 domain-containing protein [Zongyangia hominis]|uniref:DUF1540 domain-containing protein n=1 Tax=Zongyangia hominis TaxID=2763677 RepID=A0A926I622_9FIRM|nr:DUF1540 domain-containing protein [Zongyangia hominis]MBC8569549.1 DUF1540 domain-containing protein [Zongyangia hominis]
MQQEQQTQANHITGVRCEVVNCAYNEGRRYCTAKEIKVGPAFAAMNGDTQCSTFKPQ